MLKKFNELLKGGMALIFKNILDLRKTINELRKNLYELEGNKRISHLEVLEVKRKLEREVVMLQKIMNEIRF